METKSKKNIIAGIFLIAAFVVYLIGRLSIVWFWTTILITVLGSIQLLMFSITCFVNSKKVMPIISSVLLLPSLYFNFSYSNYLLIYILIGLIIVVMMIVGASIKKAKVLRIIAAVFVPLIFINYGYIAWSYDPLPGIVTDVIFYALAVTGFVFYALELSEEKVVCQPEQEPAYVYPPAQEPVYVYQPVYQPVQQPVYQPAPQPVYQQPVYQPAPSQQAAPATAANPNQAAAALKTYKDLLDTGVISQEEFDAKKKQILGI